MKQRIADTIDLTISDALANLNALANIKIDINEPIGLVKKHKIVVQDEELSYRTINWFIQEDAEELIENVKDTYKVLLEYLKDIYEKDFIVWDDPKCKKGFQAIMVMAAEAANKIDQYISLLPKQPGIEKINDCEEFKLLKEFYLEKIMKKFKESLEGTNAWDEEWKENEKAFLLDIEKSGLKDFEVLKNDEDYELFYLVDEEDKSYFDQELIRNIKLFCDYDQKSLKNIEEDPLLKIRVLLDKDFQISSKQILDRSSNFIDKFYKEKVHAKIDNELISLVNKALFALMLASNPKNLITNSFFKNSIEYFHDFQKFLREIVQSDEYQKIIAYSLEDEKTKIIKELIQILCRNLYLRLGGIKQEMIGFIHLLINKGDELRKYKYPKEATFWTTVLENDESMRLILNFYPNGPLMKLLDAIRQNEENIVGFDSILQDNVPMKFFEIDHVNNKLMILKVPSPTLQDTLLTAQITEEFKAFLRSFNENEKYLFINLQDQNSFKESARCKALDVIQKRSDFKNNIAIVNMNKYSDFYHQSGVYMNLNNALEFKKELKKELYKYENSYLFSLKDLSVFIDDAIDLVHKYFFTKKDVLTRKNRLDFIEIFYNFLILKLVEIYNPKVMSFTCKDSIDLGAASSASFYAFLKFIKEESFIKESEDYFRWLVYSNALLVRERAINSKCLIRTVSSLNLMDLEFLSYKDKLIKEMSAIYDPSFIKSIKVVEH
ncbi:MAG: hypothetical protein WC688_02410 [Parachlamydiales bacterium]